MRAFARGSGMEGDGVLHGQTGDGSKAQVKKSLFTSAMRLAVTAMLG